MDWVLTSSVVATNPARPARRWRAHPRVADATMPAVCQPERVPALLPALSQAPVRRCGGSTAAARLRQYLHGPLHWHGFYWPGCRAGARLAGWMRQPRPPLREIDSPARIRRTFAWRCHSTFLAWLPELAVPRTVCGRAPPNARTGFCERLLSGFALAVIASPGVARPHDPRLPSCPAPGPAHLLRRRRAFHRRPFNEPVGRSARA